MRPSLSLEQIHGFIEGHKGWVQREVDDVMLARREAAAKQGELLACGPGCDACCHYFITIGPIDALRIASRIRKEGGDTWENRRALMRWHDQFVQTEFDAARYNRKWLTCLFLKDGKCSVYEDRPVVCRTCNALGSNTGCQRSDEPIPHKVLLFEDIKKRAGEGNRIVRDAAWMPADGSMPEMVVWALDVLAFMEARDRAAAEAG